MRTKHVDIIYFFAAVWLIIISIQQAGLWAVRGSDKYHSEQQALTWKDKTR